MKDLGLEGKPTATHAGEELEAHLRSVVEGLDPYPHAALSLGTEEKKQTTRLLKIECPGCGYVCRTTAKWLAEGIPTCHCGTLFEEA
jgi:hypothetical protein